MRKKKSKKLSSFIFIVILLGIGYFIFLKMPKSALAPAHTQQGSTASSPIVITESKISEANFTGSKPVIAGDSTLATSAQSYVDQTISDFKKEADTDVPDMRIKLGADAPTAIYTIDINATYVKNPKTESIVLDEYSYTGGANGNSTYKVFTARLSDGKILTLADVITSSKQSAFVSYVKKALIDWRPEGSTESVVFPDDVGALTFSSFTEWTLDKNNLTIYFDKYAIGPGSIGAVIFPIPVSKLQTFLKPL